MAFAAEFGISWGEAVLRLLIHPFYYIGFLLILLQYRRQIQLERKLFHTRQHSLRREAWRLLLYGLAGGLGVSVVMVLLGSALTQEAVFLLWGISAVLILFRLRFLCMVYAAGILGVVQAVLEWVPAEAAEEVHALGWLVRLLDRVDVSGLLALAGILHVAEALLMRWQGSRTASPLFYESKRGKIVGGFHLYGFWPVPLFLMVPAPTGGFELPWQTLFGGGSGMGNASWTFLAVPFVLGFTERTLSGLPRLKARRSSANLLAYSLAVVGAAVLSHFWSVLLLPASLLAVGLHELLIWYSAWKESQATPFFVHDTSGLKILSVIPGSPAHEVGLQTGEVISRVNGVKVQTKDELHAAMRINSAFCRMEVINLEGQTKFVSRAIFSGEHHQLGILLCPDEEAPYFIEEKQRAGILSFWRKTPQRGLSENRETRSM